MESRRQELEIRKAEAKARCKEIYATIEKLNRLIHSYNNIYIHWRCRFEDADRKLAKINKLINRVKKTPSK